MALTTVNSDGVKDDSIKNIDVKSDAAIAGTKISPDFGSQNIVTTGNIDINTSPWSVTGGDWRNLSISGESANSGGFLWLGNGAAATNADLDLGRINFLNNTIITSQIAGSTQTTANDDGRLTFHTKETGGNLEERIRITSSGKLLVGKDSGSYITDILATDSYLRLTKAADTNFTGIRLDRDASDSAGAFLGLAGGSGDFINSAAQHDFCIRSQANILFGTNGAWPAARFTVGSDLIIGGHTAEIEPAGYTPHLEIHGTSDDAGMAILRYSADASGPTIVLGKSRNATIGSNSTVSENDNLGAVEFYGTDTNFEPGAAIKAFADGEWLSGGDNTDSPGRLSFWTTPNGSDDLQERLRIHSDGEVEIKEAAEGQTVLSCIAAYANSSTVDIQTWARSDSAVKAAMKYSHGTNSIDFGTTTNHPLILQTNNTEAVRITSGGSLQVKGDANPNAVFDRGSANTTNVNLQYNGTLTGQLGAANGEFQISAAGASTPLVTYVNGEERLRITSTGKLIISPNTATTAEFDYAGVYFTSDNSTVAEGLFINNIGSGTGGNASISFSGDSGNRKKSAISHVRTGNYGRGDLTFSIDPDADSGELDVTAHERLRITSGGDVELPSGNLKLAANKGINFSAYATSGNPSSNLLDDYEEGSWTIGMEYHTGSAWATVGFDVNPSNTTGYYVKIGKLVHVQIYTSAFNVNTTATGEYARISGLPFTNMNGYSVMSFTHGTSFTNDALTGYVEAASDTVRPTQTGGTITDTWADGTVYMMMSGSYEVA